VVTGGSRGLGLALSRALLARGAKLAVCARDENELAAAQSELRRAGNVFVSQADVTDRADIGRFLFSVEERLGPVDILINNAGTILVGPYDDMTLDDIRSVIEVNLFGAINTMDAVLPSMRRRKTGNIVNVASIGGLVPVPHLAAYCAAKFGLNGFSQTVAAEMRKHGIKVTVVNPGLMRTGSPTNATFKGRTKAEYGWFSLSDSIPWLTISAEHAARDILAACRRGRPYLVATAPAKIGAFLHALSPGLFVRAMTLVNALLPKATGDASERARGHESESWASPSPLTALTERAARENNEWPARRPVTDLPG
jgi:short-subunit dehydrogenase